MAAQTSLNKQRRNLVIKARDVIGLSCLTSKGTAKNE
jgi:hypothetical protein